MESIAKQTPADEMLPPLEDAIATSGRETNLCLKSHGPSPHPFFSASRSSANGQQSCKNLPSKSMAQQKSHRNRCDRLHATSCGKVNCEVPTNLFDSSFEFPATKSLLESSWLNKQRGTTKAKRVALKRLLQEDITVSM